MIKKTISSVVITTLFVLSWSSITNASFSFKDAATDTTQTTNETSTTEDTTTNDNISISNMDVVFDKDSLPADGKSSTIIYIKVNDSNNNSLDDSKVDLTVTPENDNWKIEKIEYKKDTQLFEVTYIAGTTAWNVWLKVKAVAKSDPSIKLEQLEDFKLTEVPKKEVKEQNDTTTSNDVNDILTNLDKGDNVKEEKGTNTETNTKINDINIISSKIIDENRLKITFDRKIFLPDDPLSLIEIKKKEDGSKVKIANVTLSDDEMSLIVLTKDNLEKVPYLVSINEVIDGDTKKKVTVTNWELTVTGLNEIFIFLVWILLSSGIIYIRRRKI